MPDYSENHSNPLAPAGHRKSEDDGFPNLSISSTTSLTILYSKYFHMNSILSTANLTNDDFRKLMMTPSVQSRSNQSFSNRHSDSSRPSHVEDPNEDAATRRRKKKLFFAKQHKLVEEREAELAKTYRDRAKERRETQGDEPLEQTTTSSTNDYRSVAPNTIKIGPYFSQHRKQLIQESKYLGGDMEHTHLVKGLDFALLEKVKAEIVNKAEEENEQELELLAEQAALKAEATRNEEKQEIDINNVQVSSNFARRILTTVSRKRPHNNELFLTGRMAYIVDLEDNPGAEREDSFDIPVTLIRSKADCPNVELSQTLTTNDIIINKLTQILSYLRQGRREGRKIKKRDKALGKEKRVLVDEKIREMADMSIYGEDGEKKKRNRDSDKKNSAKKRSGHYFEKPKEMEDNSVPVIKKSAREMVNSINDRFSHKDPSMESKQWASVKANEDGKGNKPSNNKLKEKMNIDSYAECYPGMMESADAYGDSDDEADYMQMDLGHKKGPVGRWDFETHEEYSQYMSKKEQLPKAAFQFGVKMSDGRKTRRVNGPKDDKAHLDKEWQKIQSIIEKRKQ